MTRKGQISRWRYAFFYDGRKYQMVDIHGRAILESHIIYITYYKLNRFKCCIDFRKTKRFRARLCK